MLNTVRILTLTAGCAALLTSASGQAPPPAQGGTNDPQAAAVELLRRVIAEQQKNPDKIIRTPTNATPAKPSRSQPTTAAPRLSRAELERQFLEGRITAKQFQRAAEDLEKNPPPPPPRSPVAPSTSPAVVTEQKSPETKGASREPAPAALSPKAASAIPSKVITNQPAVTVAPAAEEAPEQKALADVEAKIDEILARREAMRDAAKTNAPAASPSPGEPLTRRQQLDALLRQLIQGKVTDAEYKAQREKLLALPE